MLQISHTTSQRAAANAMPAASWLIARTTCGAERLAMVQSRAGSDVVAAGGAMASATAGITPTRRAAGG
jgi:hypothetical protein